MKGRQDEDMAKITMVGSGDVSEISALLLQGIRDSGLSCEMIDSVRRTNGTAQVNVMVFEKYYWRASSRASLTVVICGENGQVTVDAIGSGGGQGVVFKFSWGAEDDFVGTVGDILRQYGFQAV